MNVGSLLAMNGAGYSHLASARIVVQVKLTQVVGDRRTGVTGNYSRYGIAPRLLVPASARGRVHATCLLIFSRM